jgi:effector-binding domain-containing protein
MKSILCVALLTMIASCNNSNTPNTKNDSTPTTVKATPIAVEEKEVAAQTFMVVKDSAKDDKEVGEKLKTSFGKIMDCSKKCKMTMASAPTAWFSSSKAPYTFEAGAAFTTNCPKPENGIYNKELKAGKALVAHYFGDYSKMQVGYDAIMKYALEKKMALGTGAWEVYISDPMIEKDTAKWQTDIYFPIK